MDLRLYDLRAEALEPSEASDQADTPRTRIQLAPTLGDADVQQMVEEKAGDFAELSARLWFLMWGRKVFDGDSSFNPTPRRSRLSEAMAVWSPGRDGHRQWRASLGSGGLRAQSVE